MSAGLAQATRAALAALAALAVGCSGGRSSSSSSSAAVTLAPPSSSAAAGAAALPAQLEAGTAALALGPGLVRFVVTGCSLKPIIDADGVALVVDVTGDDGQGGGLEVTRKTTAGGKALPTTTDTISYASASGAQLIAQRFEVGGTVRDLRDPAATTPLLTVDGLNVRASGLFGSLGAVAGTADLVHGDLLVACTDEALRPPTASSSG